MPSFSPTLASQNRGRRDSVTLCTSLGNVEIELYWDHAPLTCWNFYTLAQKGYYDGTLFHRVIRDFMAQSGDPSGTGRGGQSAFDGGKRFPDEIHRDLKHVGAGILSMANAGPGTNGSQFFLTLAACEHLDGKHTIFGRVKGGMAVLKKIGESRTDVDRPLQDVKILKTNCDSGPQEAPQQNGNKGKGKKKGSQMDPMMGAFSR